MNFGLFNWIVVIGLVSFLTYWAVDAVKYNKSVADFLAANRCAGKYLLSVNNVVLQMGGIAVIQNFELFLRTGWSNQYWGYSGVPLWAAVGLLGFIIYRFRQSRALTMSQFFEIRYSRKFRIYAGLLTWVAGLLSYGIIPGVAAKFFIAFCGFPPEFHLLGLTIPVYPIVVIVLIGTALFFTFMGGQISVLITDFWQGVFTTAVVFIIGAYLWFTIPWEHITEAMKIVSHPGKSYINPFDISDMKDFNISYYLLNMLMGLYGYYAWQGGSGYNSSALTPHDAKMGPVISGLRFATLTFSIWLISMVAIVYLNHPQYSNHASTIQSYLNSAYPGNEYTQTQMRVPVAMGYFVPKVLMGFFAAAMLGFFISTNDTCLHSWGTIFVQDVIGPFRKKPFDPKTHLIMLRLSIIMVAIFALFWSCFFVIRDHLIMYSTLAMAVYMAGAGAVLIGGLYWKRGTTTGAWSAMITGSTLAVSGVIIRQFQAFYADKGEILFEGKIMSYIASQNGAVLAFYSAMAAILVYVIVSLLGGKTVNMDKLLHRGEYAVEEMEKIKASERLEALYPEYKTGPRVYYKGLHRYFKCFIGGSVAVEANGTTDCAEGVRVTLIRDSNKIDEAVTDNYGDFKFDNLEENSGHYGVELELEGYEKKTLELDLKASVYLGSILL